MFSFLGRFFFFLKCKRTSPDSPRNTRKILPILLYFWKKFTRLSFCPVAVNIMKLAIYLNIIHNYTTQHTVIEDKIFTQCSNLQLKLVHSRFQRGHSDLMMVVWRLRTVSYAYEFVSNMTVTYARGMFSYHWRANVLAMINFVRVWTGIFYFVIPLPPLFAVVFKSILVQKEASQ